MAQERNVEAFFPDGPMESRGRITQLFTGLVLSLSCLLLAVAGYEIARFRADARTINQALASVIAPIFAAVVLGRLTQIRISGGWSAGSHLPGVVLFSLLIAGAVVSSTVPEPILLLLYLLAVSYLSTTGSSPGIVCTGAGLVVLTGALLAVTRGAAASAFALTTGALVLIVSISLGKILKEAASNFRLLGQARSAASTLSDIILRVEQTVHRARIHEMTRERRRVAREIHDSVGYTLTGLIVQLGVVNRLVTNPEAQSRIGNLETIARRALQEIREEVGILRAEVNEDVVPFLTRWIQVCDYFAECTGIRVDHSFRGDLAQVPGPIGETVYRVIQEGLTNAYRHGEATIVDVSMTWKRELGLILLRISDNGRGLDSLKPGNGLNGIRERVESVSGSLVIQSEPGRGFDLGVDIPWSGPVRQVAGG